ncbi:hypothetical protein H5202_06125 [Shewanella sp. SG41-4]|uniref:hypothetical protein n=1 Tax=Shewanella sp. SG41-4 TaxID=2760976 RepID=UPI001600220B|nr:hypothetical protein [Shewanella sp. SG41-4]MBB1438263.1 hypothetical protein [Shewanella sp. SG41-4]
MFIDIQTIEGEVSKISNTSETVGEVTARGPIVSGRIETHQHTYFRVNGKVCKYKSRDGLPLSDGDEVIASGFQKNGVIEVCSFYNKTTQTIKSVSSLSAYAYGLMLIVLGIPLSFIYIGVPIVLGGILIIYLGIKASECISLVTAAMNLDLHGEPFNPKSNPLDK